MSEYSNELIEKLKKAQNVEEVAELLKTYCQNEAEAKRRYASTLKSSGVGADECIGCGQCEGACPQGLPIIDLLARTAEALA